jgi:hypothetical protein
VFQITDLEIPYEDLEGLWFWLPVGRAGHQEWEVFSFPG